MHGQISTRRNFIQLLKRGTRPRSQRSMTTRAGSNEMKTHQSQHNVAVRKQKPGRENKCETSEPVQWGHLGHMKRETRPQSRRSMAHWAKSKTKTGPRSQQVHRGPRVEQKRGLAASERNAAPWAAQGRLRASAVWPPGPSGPRGTICWAGPPPG